MIWLHVGRTSAEKIAINAFLGGRNVRCYIPRSCLIFRSYTQNAFRKRREDAQDYATAVCCSVLQRVAVCCSVLQCVAVCCSLLPCSSSKPLQIYTLLRVEFLLKTDSGYPGMRKLLYSPWQTLSIPFALTPIGQLHQSPPSPVPGDLGRCPSHQSHATRT